MFHCFVEVDYKFIEDDFNLYGLSNMVLHYKLAKAVILDYDIDFTQQYASVDEKEVLFAAKELYGLIHARYILTNPGITAIEKIYRKGVFGTCPRCISFPLLPYGPSVDPNVSHTFGYCMKCREVYKSEVPVLKRIDGAYYGPTFCHLFELCWRESHKAKTQAIGNKS